MALALTLTLAAPAVQADAAWEPVLGFDLMTALARCETGNDTTHRTRSYVGAWGFYRRTWDLFADTPASKAHRLSWNQQARVLDRAFWFGHTVHGRKQWAVGPFGHGCFKRLWKSNLRLRTRVCNNGRQQVRRWCRQ